LVGRLSEHSAEDERDAIGMLLISSSKENNSNFTPPTLLKHRSSW